MGHKIVVGPINKGLRTDRTAFVIDNDAFPTLNNAYQWRGRVKRKRGTSLLGRLTRFFLSTSPSYSSITTIILGVGGSGNILTGFGLEANGNIVPGSVSITDSTAGQIYLDTNEDGTLIGNLGGTGTIVYSTGAITISGGAGHVILASFLYYPDLPVMGLEDLILNSTQFPGTLAFDTTYSYNILTTNPYSIYDVSFYKNPPADGTLLPGYVPKAIWTPVRWNGNDYQQFWTVNYQGALWATNGAHVPFDATNIGMQFAPSNTITWVATNPIAIQVIITNCPLVIGDFVFVNEWTVTATGKPADGLNFQSGYVTACVPNTPALAVKTVTINFPNATIPVVVYTPGIVQYLTNTADNTIDCLRWYDGDPTNGNPTNPSFVQGKGWVNFMPPLSQFSFSISDLPARQYYLVGAKIILPFKDRLLFFGPIIQASSGTPIYLQDTVIYSQNGTPYYTASFTGPVLSPTTGPIQAGFEPILVPVNQTATANAYFEDQTGFGGFISAGISQPITTASPNEDVLIVGFATLQTRLIYSGNDIVPFNFFVINSELGSGSTFSVINMDQGVLTRGNRGYIITGQTSTQRIDLEIPDQVFEISLTNNGSERFCAQRDFINEWVYFTYPSDQSSYIYPTQTLQFNYRDNSWGIFEETYTTYGAFREASGLTWQTLPSTLTWATWTDPWDSGSSNLLQPRVIAGNQQGFILFREDDQTTEGNSLTIQNISANTVTSPNHSLNTGDYIIINGAIGTIGAQVNGKIFSVVSPSTNTFFLNPTVGSGTYFGGGTIQRMYVPMIATKQFPVAWELSRKTRIGPQQYMLTQTPAGQIELLIFLSQNVDFAYNDPNIQNDSLIYSVVLYTCQESTNLGLTPANTNLLMYSEIDSSGSSSNPQEQIWHRMNTSLIGDTVQVGFTMSDAQMRSFIATSQTFTITGATQAYPCVLTSANSLSSGQMISIAGVIGMTQLNYDGSQATIYQVISATPTSITINVDSSGFGAYVSGGIVTQMQMPNQFEEIELHSFILDVSPSMILA